MNSPKSPYEDVRQLFGPDESEIVRYLQRHVSDDLLRTIAGFDYGYEAEQYLAHLVRIRSGDRVPDIATLMPREVLQLTSHHDPDERPCRLFAEPYPQGIGPPEAVREGHLARLFACVSLLRSSISEGDAGYNDDSYLTVQAVKSGVALGGEAVTPLRGLLAWRLQFVTGFDDETAFGCGILVLEDVMQGAFAARLALADVIARSEFGTSRAQDEPPDQQSTFLRRAFRGEAWRPLIEQHLCNASGAGSADDARRLAALGHALLRC